MKKSREKKPHTIFIWCMISEITAPALLMISAGNSLKGKPACTKEAYTSTCNQFPLLPLHFRFVQVNHFQDCYLTETQFILLPANTKAPVKVHRELHFLYRKHHSYAFHLIHSLYRTYLNSICTSCIMAFFPSQYRFIVDSYNSEDLVKTFNKRY